VGHASAGQDEIFRRPRQNVPEFGLAPPGVSADWNRFAYRLFNDSQYCYGLQSAGRALADIGDPAGETILEDANRYRETSTGVPLDAGPIARGSVAERPWIPGDPRCWILPATSKGSCPAKTRAEAGATASNSARTISAVNRVFDPASKDVDWMIDYLEDVRFLRTRLLNPPDEKPTNRLHRGGYANSSHTIAESPNCTATRRREALLRSYFNAIPSVVCGEDLSFWRNWKATTSAAAPSIRRTRPAGSSVKRTRCRHDAATNCGSPLCHQPLAQGRNEGVGSQCADALRQGGLHDYLARREGEIDAVVRLPVNCTPRKSCSACGIPRANRCNR